MLPSLSSAMDLFTSIVYHEPVMLSNLLDRGLPGVILNSFIVKDVREDTTAAWTLLGGVTRASVCVVCMC